MRYTYMKITVPVLKKKKKMCLKKWIKGSRTKRTVKGDDNSNRTSEIIESLTNSSSGSNSSSNFNSNSTDISCSRGVATSKGVEEAVIIKVTAVINYQDISFPT